jgi:hypothetical protein
VYDLSLLMEHRRREKPGFPALAELCASTITDLVEASAQEVARLACLNDGPATLPELKGMYMFCGKPSGVLYFTLVGRSLLQGKTMKRGNRLALGAYLVKLARSADCRFLTIGTHLSP